MVLLEWIRVSIVPLSVPVDKRLATRLTVFYFLLLPETPRHSLLASPDPNSDIVFINSTASRLEFAHSVLPHKFSFDQLESVKSTLLLLYIQHHHSPSLKQTTTTNMDEEKITLPASKMRARNVDFQSNGKRKQAFHFPTIGLSLGFGSKSSNRSELEAYALPVHCNTYLYVLQRFSLASLYCVFLSRIPPFKQESQALLPRKKRSRLAWRKKLRIYELLSQEASAWRPLGGIEKTGFIEGRRCRNDGQRVTLIHEDWS